MYQNMDQDGAINFLGFHAVSVETELYSYNMFSYGHLLASHLWHTVYKVPRG